MKHHFTSPHFKSPHPQVRRMDFYDSPDYEYLRNMFIDVLDEGNMECDWIFDWTNRRDEISSPISITSKGAGHQEKGAPGGGGREVAQTAQLLYATPPRPIKTTASKFVNTSAYGVDQMQSGYYSMETGMMLARNESPVTVR